MLYSVYISGIYFQFQPEMIDTLYKFAKFQYEVGDYSGAAEYLYFVRVMVSCSKTGSTWVDMEGDGHGREQTIWRK